MPIESFTGLPGNGKTALMMEHLAAQAKLGERPLWVAGVDGLQPGFASVLDDPRAWNAHDPSGDPTCDCHQDGNLHAHLIPDGSLIYVDEAWKWFGHLHDASRQSTPKHVLDLAEHRHRGIDFVWTYQQPSQIYPFARGLMADHHHVVRRYGTSMIDVFSWPELNEDVKSSAKRENALRKTRTLPKDSFAMYKSAEIHTIKPRIPWKVWLIPACAIAFVALAWYLVTALRPDNFAANLTGKKPATASAVAASPGQGGKEAGRKKPLYENPTEYARAHLPRQATQPWSAPVYDERGVTADPELFCMSSREGEGMDGEWMDYSCTCLTEQGTAYYISDGECRTIARRGPSYNPYKERRDDDRNSGDFQPAQAQASPAVEPGRVIAGDVGKVGSGGEAGAPGTAP